MNGLGSIAVAPSVPVDDTSFQGQKTHNRLSQLDERLPGDRGPLEDVHRGSLRSGRESERRLVRGLLSNNRSWRWESDTILNPIIVRPVWTTT